MLLAGAVTAPAPPGEDSERAADVPDDSTSSPKDAKGSFASWPGEGMGVT